MTQDEIIEMAMQAEFVSHGKPSDEESELFVCLDKDIYKFAELVAAKEREACAKVCDEYSATGKIEEFDRGWLACAKNVAAVIRARGNA